MAYLALALLGLGGSVTWLINARIVRQAAGATFRRLDDLPPRFTVIVPGAFVDGDTPSDVLEDRLEAAAAVYHAGLATRVLVSGDHGTPAYDEVRVMRLFLMGKGVPSAAIFMDHAGFRTLDTMQRAAAVFGVGGAVVVTQEFHLARSLYLAKAAGLDAVGLIADKRKYVYETNYACREFLARVAAFLDLYVWRRRARFLGEPIPIGGDARLTHDDTTASP